MREAWTSKEVVVSKKEAWSELAPRSWRVFLWEDRQAPDPAESGVKFYGFQ
jgi:hypothetical protein